MKYSRVRGSDGQQGVGCMGGLPVCGKMLVCRQMRFIVPVYSLHNAPALNAIMTAGDGRIALIERITQAEVQEGIMTGRRWFQRAATSTVLIIYCLILVGGIVRATGSGMGCPDWPTCFGQWVPPVSEAELPSNYQSIYAERGYADTAFNVTKTWTEYLNRLLGVFTGIAILATLLLAVPLRNREPVVFYLALAGFVLVALQGWLGSRVVASNLAPGMITLHMLLAQIIAGIVISARLHVSRDELVSADEIRSLPASVYPLLLVAMAAGLLQLLLGTQVREAIDLIARQSDYANRHLWIENLPWIFTLHKGLAIPLLALNGWLIYQILQYARSRPLKLLSISLALLLLGTSVIGMSMDRLAVPIYAQPLHLWFASLIFGNQLALQMLLHYARVNRPAVLQPA